MNQEDKKKKNKEEKDEKRLEEAEEIVRFREELEEVDAKYKRALADYQNLEKRVRDERSGYVLRANEQMLLRIIPVLDTLMLAKKHDDNPTLAVSISQFLDVLKSEGVTKIETEGKPFDPHLMEGLEKVEDGDIVVEEIRPGYMLYDKLLRPAQVKVGKKATS